MKSKYTVTRLENIELLIKFYETTKVDEFTLSHISKFITVLTSGIYEDVIKNILVEYTDKEKVSREIRDYIYDQLKKSFRNPDFGNLTGLISKFSKKWENQIKIKVTEEQKESLNSIVNNKNLIAHGDNCTITFSNIKEYYYKSKEIIILLDSLLL